MSAPLRVAVSDELLRLPAMGGHGKTWNRVLTRLEDRARVQPAGRRIGRRPGVTLADGHAPLPRSHGPLVVQVHEAAWFDPVLRNMLGGEFLAEIERHTETAVRAAAHVITPSQAAARDVAQAYDLDPARVHGVHHGADPVFRPDAGGGREIVAGALGRDAPYVLYVGVIHPRKNLAALREAMAELIAAGLPHALVVVGGPRADHADQGELEEAAAELPGARGHLVRLPATTDQELAGLMAGADALCLPSFYEGFGIPVIEAMACGTPAVVSDRGALPEVVGDAGVVTAPDPEAVGTALQRVLTEPGLREELGRAALARAGEFTWERTADEWLTVLRVASAEH